MKVLLAIDDSKFSEAAIQAVMAQLQPKGTELEVLHVVDLAIPIPTLYAAEFRRESLKQGRELVKRTEQLLIKAGFKVLTAIEEGDPRSNILGFAAHWNANLIILGSHGRNGLDHFLMGSVSEAVLHHAPCSVQVVRIRKEPNELEEASPRLKVLLAIDDSRFSEAARDAIMRQLRPKQTEVCVLHIVEPYYSHIAGAEPTTELKLVAHSEQLLAGAGFKVHTAIEEGDPRTKVVDYAANWKPDLLVVGSHGRSGLERLLMGSVSENVARHSGCSVEVVRIPVEAPRHLSVNPNEKSKDVGKPQANIQTPIALESKQHKQVCKVCGKPSSSDICPICADKIRAGAVARKKREDKGEE